MPDELYSKGVQLWDKNGASASLNNGSGLLLHPETELKYIKPAVGGGISSSVNSLWFDPNAAMVSGLSGIIAESYCPLEKVNAGALGGNTQYANMYTGGIESAVVTELPGSTGYGTLINAISTITSVRPTTGTNSATNSYIPTERAVALALAGKENIIVGGDCINVSKDVFSTTVAVKTQSGTLPALSAAVNSRVPTERCARQAIDITSEILNNSASALNSRLSVLSSYVSTSTIKITDYATQASAGIVKPSAGLSIGAAGLLAVSKATVTSDSGNISAYQGAYTLASGSAIGGVVCMNTIESAGVAAYKNEPIVPTVQAVYDYVSQHGGNGKPVVSAAGGGIGVTDQTSQYSLAANLKAPLHVPTGTGNSSSGFICVSSATTDKLGVVYVPTGSGLLITNGALALNSATTSTIGGVMIPSNRGLSLGVSGSLTLSRAPVSSIFGYASAALANNVLGGVVVMMGDLDSAAGLWTDIAQDDPVVPNISAMKSYTSANYVSRTEYATTNSAGIIKVGTGLSMTSTATGGAASRLDVKAATTNTLGGVVIGTGINVNNGTISLAGDIDASYKGPFAVAPDGEDDLVKVSSGYVKWLDGQLEVQASSSISMPFNSFLYLTGSSGMIQGSTVTGSNYQIYSGTVTWSRTSSATKNDRYKWEVASGTGATRWAADAVPSSGTKLYANSSTDTVADTVTGVSGYYIQLNSTTDNYTQMGLDPISGYKWSNDYFDTTIYRYSFTMNSTVYYRTEAYSDGRYGWTPSGEGGSTQWWTTKAIPVTNDPVYSSPLATTSLGKASSISSEVLFTGRVKRTTYETDGYYQWADINGGYGYLFYTTSPNPVNGAPVYRGTGIVPAAGITSNVSLSTVYTAAGLPYSNTRTMPITGNYNFNYTTAQPALPPAGRFYTMIAQNISSTTGGVDSIYINQHQYGTIWHEHWGDDYRGQFAISRVTLDQARADAAVLGSYPYKYVVNGGRIYGGIDFKSGKLWQGSLISGGIIAAPGDMEYPKTTDAIDGAQRSDALYFQYGTTNEVWLNIWSGTWPTNYGGPGGTGKHWHTVVHSKCLEGYIDNCYSVQLGWLTPNGAPQQEHKGAISIRGRWA